MYVLRPLTLQDEFTKPYKQDRLVYCWPSNGNEVGSKSNAGKPAIHLWVNRCYLGHIESPNFPAKYNATQLNELAKLFKCSPKDFWPEKAL